MRLWRLLTGNNKVLLRDFPDHHFDSVVCDPPYALTASRPGGRSKATEGAVMKGFMGMEWDGALPDVETWREVLRVLKPGGHLLVFCATRTQHRMVCNIEDAGFEIRDVIGWVYSEGFPKSKDVALGIDKLLGHGQRGHAISTASTKQPNGADLPPGERLPPYKARTPEAEPWEGWGTALKPAMELITVARKPLLGGKNVARNVLTYGTGALNIDASRVHAPDALGREYVTKRFAPGATVDVTHDWKSDVDYRATTKAGRWPANLIHDGSAPVLDLFPFTKSGAPGGTKSGGQKNVYQTFAGNIPVDGYGDEGSAARFFMSTPFEPGELDKFVYCAKAKEAERGEYNDHPTVKPVKLMRYLVRMVTPPGGRVGDFWVGSGTTVVACVHEDLECVGMDQDEHNIDIAERRTQDAVLEKERLEEEARLAAGPEQYDLFA